MKNLIYSLLIFLTISSISIAGDCEIDIEGNGMMQYSTDNITIDSTCSEFKINLKNTGTLAVELAGHNIVISKSTDADYLTSIVNPSHGIKDGYLPKDNKVIYKTKFLGPNETTTLTLDTNKFSKGEDYVFWCSFLGHWGVMNGTITIK